MAQQDIPKSQRIIYLVSRYMDGDINFTELQELEDWRRGSTSNAQLFEQLTDTQKQQDAIRRMQQYDTKASYGKVRRLISQEPLQSKSRYALWMKLLVAASVTLIVGILLFVLNKPETANQSAMLKPEPQYIGPGSDKAILTLSNGSRIAIDDKGSGLVAVQGSTNIQKTASGKLVYEATGENKNEAAMEYNQIETPRGGQYRVQLPDGTNVWLNAASSLRYPASFAGKQRVVTLTGEAYFEVVHNKAQPFIVRTATQDVTDIGTSFNVNAYSDEPHTITTLQEGAAAVSANGKRKLLRPGQQTVNASGNLEVSEADVALAVAWKQGQLAFHRTDIKNVLRQIARWYDITIEYQGPAPDITISGGLSRQEDLSAVLKMLELSEVKFVQRGRKLLITK